MGSVPAWRKAYGALKDQTKVGLAQLNSDFKDVDVAIVKATNHVECPPKERHLRKILISTSAIRPRADVSYCLHALARRLAKTHNWTVALKTLIVIHRALREGDPTFREELLNFQQRGHILQLSNFKDDSSPVAWDCSAWVRTYGHFLEERLECFRILKYDIEAERLPKSVQGQEKGYSRTRELDSEQLLEQLPALQQLLYRLIGCRPEGAAVHNYVIQYALALVFQILVPEIRSTRGDNKLKAIDTVLKESFKIYCSINDGIINLIDKFFEMARHEAIKALDIYKRAGQQASSLSEFYEVCKGLELARNFQFPVLREPPQSFLVTMEEYIREAPRMVTVPAMPVEFPERLQLTYKPEGDVASPSEETPSPSNESKPAGLDIVAVSSVEDSAPATVPPLANNFDSADLLGFNATNTTPVASAIEESNALALAIVPSGTTTAPLQARDFDPTGWELALVNTPGTDISSVQDRQLAGGLDSLTLNSLYDEGAYRASQQPVYGSPAPNPFESSDPFAISNNTAAAPVQMSAAPQYQANPFGPYQQPVYSQPQQQPDLMMGQQNPFLDAGFGAFPINNGAHQPTSNPFGSTGLL